MGEIKVDEKVLENTVKRCSERNIIIPTFAEQKDPNKIPDKIKKRLKNIGLWDIDPLNLYRITWKNEPREQGGLFGGVNYVVFPPELTGVDATIVGLVGKWFPTGAHKVGAAFGCLVPRLVTGEFDPTVHKAVWPSTGNYCRGGAFDSALLGVKPVAVLPEEMSRERFEWLEEIGAEVHATPGCESNVKEIYDKCWEFRRTKPDYIIFNQFDEFGNAMWHYNMTGSAIEEIFEGLDIKDKNLAAFISATGSAGTLAAGDYLKEKFPYSKVVASEALQCPTLLLNGFGGHRIEGIGDKHVPWIHHTKTTDMVVAIDDEEQMRLLRLFNEPLGQEYLAKQGIKDELIKELPLLGISSISNLLSAIKTAKYYELKGKDVLFTPLTDSAEMYGSRVNELRDERGEYKESDAIVDFSQYLHGVKTDWMDELSYYDKKKLHNLKYFTWVEQQEKDIKDLNRLWDDDDFWKEQLNRTDEYDKLIVEFNEKVGLLNELD